MVNNLEKKITCTFSLRPYTIKMLEELVSDINKNSSIEVNKSMLIDMLVNQANRKKILTKLEY